MSEQRVKCTGKVKSSGGACKNYAIPGGTVCAQWHGGKAPQVAAAAERRRTEAAVKAAVVTYGLPIETTAEDALFDELYRSKGHVVWLAERVQAMAPEALIWGDTSETVKDVGAGEFPGVDTTRVQSAAAHIWLDLYQRERKHYFDVAAKIAALNLEERRVRIDEGKARVLTTVLRAVLAEHGLRLQDEAVAGSVQRHLALATRDGERVGA